MLSKCDDEVIKSTVIMKLTYKQLSKQKPYCGGSSNTLHVHLQLTKFLIANFPTYYKCNYKSPCENNFYVLIF